MDTKRLITILERELGTVKSNNVVDKVRDEIIERLEAYDTLRVSSRVLGKDLEAIKYQLLLVITDLEEK